MAGIPADQLPNLATVLWEARFFSLAQVVMADSPTGIHGILGTCVGLLCPSKATILLGGVSASSLPRPDVPRGLGQGSGFAASLTCDQAPLPLAPSEKKPSNFSEGKGEPDRRLQLLWYDDPCSPQYKLLQHTELVTYCFVRGRALVPVVLVYAPSQH